METTEEETIPSDLPEQPPLEAAPPPSRRARFQRFLRRLLITLIALLVLLGVSAVLAFFLLYLPARQELQAQQAALQESNGQVATLEARVQELSGLEATNKQLASRQQEDELHIQLLSARYDVAAAQLALEREDPARVRLALSKTPEKLERLAELVQEDQRQVVTDMQERLQLALDELEENAFAAGSDLNVLSTSLVELENTYFAAP